MGRKQAQRGKASFPRLYNIWQCQETKRLVNFSLRLYKAWEAPRALWHRWTRLGRAWQRCPFPSSSLPDRSLRKTCFPQGLNICETLSFIACGPEEALHKQQLVLFTRLNLMLLQQKSLYSFQEKAYEVRYMSTCT